MPIPPCKAASLRPLESGPRRFSASSLVAATAAWYWTGCSASPPSPPGDPLYRDAALLSAGTADQLYLATRLAICDLVLPADRAVPIVLDDALANFDDERCAAALRWLRQEAERRQILLFTCHSREAEFFAGDAGVRIQRLTGPV